MGRTGSFLASAGQIENFDIVCLGKGMAAGIPAGAVLVSPAVAEKIPRSIHTSTFGGNPLVCAGILAALSLLSDELLAHVQAVGSYFFERLKSLRSDRIRTVRGRGLMLGLQVKDGRDAVLRGLQNRRILAIPAADEVVRFLPPYILQASQVDETMAALEAILG
jgi:acetylornithine/succinyldiaminopimelate/putrescine aminotransferase